MGLGFLGLGFRFSFFRVYGSGFRIKSLCGLELLGLHRAWCTVSRV